MPKARRSLRTSALVVRRARGSPGWRVGRSDGVSAGRARGSRLCAQDRALRGFTSRIGGCIMPRDVVLPGAPRATCARDRPRPDSLADPLWGGARTGLEARDALARDGLRAPDRTRLHDLTGPA